MPFDLVIAEVEHGLFKDFLPMLSLVLHPFVIFAVFLICFKQITVANLKRQSVIVHTAMLMLAITCILHAIQGNMLSLNYLILGIGALQLGMLLAMLPDDAQIGIMRVLAIGVWCWCICIVSVYSVDIIRLVGTYPWMKKYSIDQMVLAIRYPESIGMHIYYPLITGNWNKVANLIVVMFLFSMIAIYRDMAKRHIYLVAMACMSMVIILSYSRGGILVLAGVSFINLWLSRRIESDHRGAWVLACVFMLLPLIVSVSFPAMRAGWFDNSSIVERLNQITSLAAGTHAAGTHAAGTHAAGNFNNLIDLLIGKGVGVYGTEYFNNPFAGMHNMFIDIFLAGGVTQLLGLIILFTYALYRVGRRHRRSIEEIIGGVAVLAVVILSFREFNLNYLGVSAFLSLLLGLLLGEAICVMNRYKNIQKHA